MDEIAFTKVDLPFGWLGNMSPFPIRFQGKFYKTSEALFQCLRFEGFEEIQELIRNEPSPMGAKMKAKKYKNMLQQIDEEIRKNRDIELMEMVLIEKLRSHPRLVKMLIETGTRTIIEDCSKRNRGSGQFWGSALVNGNWEGENILGNLWMKLREEYREAS